MRFGGPAALGVFLAGLAALVVGAVVLADGVVGLAGQGTVLFGGIDAVYRTSVGFMALVVGALLLAYSRLLSP